MFHLKAILPLLSTFARILVIALSGTIAIAEVSVPTLFSDNMVLQRDKPIKIWGWANPGESVRVWLGSSKAIAEADASGDWIVSLPAMPAGGPHTVTIEGENEIVLHDVLIGEVWIASGQSNMEWQVKTSTNADLAVLTAQRSPDIRFNQIWNRGSQEPQKEITNVWEVAAPETIEGFSAVAYAFAETLHNVLGVPIGIIQNAWGSSNAGTWTDRQVLINDPALRNIHEEWVKVEATYDYGEVLANYEKQLAEWEKKAAGARAAMQTPPKKPAKPQDLMTSQFRPGNLWNGRILPIAPIAVRGVIWYQGEANTKSVDLTRQSVERARQYEHLFTTMITGWRNLWDDDFSFYWSQLADHQKEAEFGEMESWPYLRHSQTGAMKLANTGQAVITDIGEANDIHPREKEEVGRRLARWALNRDYGYTDLACRSPELNSWSQNGDEIIVKFDHTGKGLRPFDTKEVKGFAVKAEDGRWHVVPGKTLGKDRVVLGVETGIKATALAYAWANNPVCNLFTIEGLPVTPFRTDVKLWRN